MFKVIYTVVQSCLFLQDGSFLLLFPVKSFHTTFALNHVILDKSPHSPFKVISFSSCHLQTLYTQVKEVRPDLSLGMSLDEKVQVKEKLCLCYRELPLRNTILNVHIKYLGVIIESWPVVRLAPNSFHFCFVEDRHYSPTLFFFLMLTIIIYFQNNGMQIYHFIT